MTKRKITSEEIEHVADGLKFMKDDYLRQHGWKSTCNTPGSFWVWTRDFADVDAKRLARHPKTASPFAPYGVIMATTDVAVSMTARELEEEPENEEID